MRKVTLIACFLVLPMVALSSYIYVEDRAARKIEAQMRAEELQAVNQALRQAMVRYTLDKGKPPKTLDDLVEAGYFKGAPRNLIDSGYFKGMPVTGPEYFDPAVPTPPGRQDPVPTPRT
jgi:type II secretory pathway pseudopilin PulG